MASEDNVEDAGTGSAPDPAAAPTPPTAGGARAKPKATSGPTTSSAKSRAAQRKVNLGSGASGSGAGTPSPRKVTKPPFYRRGGFWFLVIVAEVLVALLISYRLERSPDSVDLAGVKTDTFCADVSAIRAANIVQSSIDVAEADAVFRRQREAYQKLKQSAPDDLQPDLDRLIKSTTQLIETTQTIQQKKVENPGYTGGAADLVAAQVALEQRVALPSARLAVAVRNACNIDLDAPVTTAPSSTTVPTTAAGSSGGGTTAPGGTAVSVPPTVADPGGSTPVR